MTQIKLFDKLIVSSIRVVVCAMLMTFGIGSATAEEFVRIKSSSIGGSWYAGGAALAKLITDNYPEYIGVNIASPGLDNESIKRLGRGEAEIAFLTGPGAFNAFDGVGPTWQEPQDIKALFGLWPGVINAIVMDDSEFKTLRDLKGASIATYVEGDVNGEQVLELLKHHGVTEDNTDFFRIMKADASRMFIDKRVDAIVFYFGYGHGNLKEISAARDIRFLPPESADAEAFMSENPFYYLGDFGEEFGVPNAKQLIGPYLLAARGDLPEEMVYKITKVWFENLPWLERVLPKNIQYMNVKDPKAGVPIPLHPGAERYFKEAGLIQ
jgi:TRAP transporter TAXI family solute receptor